MKETNQFRRILCMLLVGVMLISMCPAHVHAAENGREEDTIFFATDLHAESSKLNSLLKALAYTPGLVVLGGDHVNNTNSGSLASITSDIQSVYSGVQTFFTYAAHDPNVSADSSNAYAYARTGEYFEGEDYYVYALDQGAMDSTSGASSASADFIAWAQSADSSKVIFVMCHMPIHSRRGDNAGGAIWMDALNEVGATHDIIYLWGHNHTGENSSDTSVYFVGVGGSLTPEGGSKGTINFTYMNAGYIKNGYASMVVVESDHVDVTRYSTSGSATASYTIERRFAVSHTWELTDAQDATCTDDGYETYFCADCGESKTDVIPAAGHDYMEQERSTCTGAYILYTCYDCGHSYTEALPSETTYDKASSLEEGASYVVVASGYALTYGSSAGKTSVSVSDDAITSDVTDAMIWTYEDGKMSNSSSGSAKYINVSGSSSRRTISFGTTGASVSYSSGKLKIGSSYLYYSSSSGFSGRSSGSTVTLYKVNEAMAPAGEHEYATVRVEPTCTEDGSVTYTCIACGETFTEVLEANGQHDYETVTVSATCGSEGYVTYTCADCGDSLQEILPATGDHHHTAVETVKATCTDGGYTVYTCDCGDSYTETVSALGHGYTAVVTAPTCTEEGFTTYTCACGDSYTADKTAALGHSYTAHKTDATCTAAGSVVYTCVCGDAYTEIIEAKGHDHKAVVTAPTCTEEGFTTYTCACGDIYVADQTAALGHTYESVVTAPTCTAEGYTTYTCACGDSYVADEVAALGHAYESVVTAPTCTEEGYTTYTCACGDSYVADEVAALGHAYESVVTAPTCTEEGFTTYTCACGDSYVADEVAALGHAYESVVTAPTCTEEGYTTYICACGDSYVADKTAALGHSYTTTEEDGALVHTCACGHSYTEKLDFTYGQASALTDGDRFVITVKSGSKYYALSHENNSLSAVQVKVSDGEITTEITEDLLWTYEDGKLSYESDGDTYYLNTASSGWWWNTSTTLGVSTGSSASISFSGTKLKVGSSYLRYSSGKLSLSSRAGSAYIFVEE